MATSAMDCNDGDHSLAHRISEPTLSLPPGPRLTAEEQDRLITILRTHLS